MCVVLYVHVLVSLAAVKSEVDSSSSDGSSSDGEVVVQQPKTGKVCLHVCVCACVLVCMCACIVVCGIIFGVFDHCLQVVNLFPLLYHCSPNPQVKLDLLLLQRPVK